MAALVSGSSLFGSEGLPALLRIQICCFVNFFFVGFRDFLLLHSSLCDGCWNGEGKKQGRLKVAWCKPQKLAQSTLVSLHLRVSNEAVEAAQMLGHSEQGCLFSLENSLRPFREVSVSGEALQVICAEKRI